MTFQAVLAALRARRLVATAVLLCVLAAGAYALHRGPVYQADAEVVLTPPRTPSSPNTLAAVTPSIAAAGLAADDLLLSPNESPRLRALGVLDPFTVVPRNNGTTETPAYRVPTEEITVTGGDAAAVLDEADTLVAEFAAELRAMQTSAGVATRAQITVGVLAPPIVVPLHGSHSRGAVAVVLLAIGAAVAAAVRFRPRRARGADRVEENDAVLI
ncbi:MAG TPA: hypothetical protein VFN97_01445 [Actinospica sp.]|nr:hypothetical protein [Actinospica sp.]